jgi:lysophospholipid acyltransferase (LPLAT)-like uncharacterized protein
MAFVRSVLRSRSAQKAIGVAASEYLRLVYWTNRIRFDPPDIYEQVATELPAILAMWHGQHFLMPFLRRPDQPRHRTKVLISRHRDGEMNAVAAERLGIGTIRGSGDHGGRYDRKGGVGAFKEMLGALSDGYNVALTADVPKVSRVAGAGIAMLGRYSGRPIFPIAAATSRRIELKTWDRVAVNLPLGRLVFAACEPIRVPADADDADLERARKAIEDGLNRATARAYELADAGGKHR